MNKIDELYLRMTGYEAGCPERIHHFVKVHSFARMIAIAEKLTPHERYTIEAAALVHDIGIKPAMEIYGTAAGPYQERAGMPEAKKLLDSLHFDLSVVDRVVYLVGKHHTYTDVDGIDYRILIEADFLVNLHENHASKEQVLEAYNAHFRTEAGRELCRTMFGIE